MTKKIVAIGASSSSTSINRKFADFAAHQIQGAEVNLMDLNHFEMPIFSVDREKADGIPQLAYDFKSHLKEADGIIISFAEHNGAYSAAFKNIMDWISRIKEPVWLNKPMLLMAAAPGSRGGQTVLDIAVNKFKWMAADIKGSFSLPFFDENFSEEKGITDEQLATEFQQALRQFEAAI